MKVLCIIAGNRGNGKMNPHKKLEEGVVYNVLNEVMANDRFGNSVPAYELYEFPGGGWERDRFIPLSQIDEMELLEQRQNQLQEL